ncbi:hypothetical protein [Neobacillus muris]|uniref:hypothetical protein n=1 Tax=Neobacillus muris TaxID=2941334 RepID=UPI00203D2327|nr:hypothetical protein [Neobacillus muris]
MNSELQMMQGAPVIYPEIYALDPNDARLHHGFGHFGGFGRPWGWGFRPWGFGFPFLTGLAAGALLSPFSYGFGYPYYGYPYGGFW